MNTQQIKRILRADVRIRRIPLVKVLARDQLPTRIDKSRCAAFVINTDPICMPGSHWVALYYDGFGRFVDILIRSVFLRNTLTLLILLKVTQTILLRTIRGPYKTL